MRNGNVVNSGCTATGLQLTREDHAPADYQRCSIGHMGGVVISFSERCLVDVDESAPLQGLVIWLTKFVVQGIEAYPMGVSR